MNHNAAAAPITTGHLVRVQYRGATNTRPSRYVATWEGWPSDDSRTVRKTLGYTSERDDMARAAAGAFADWLNDGSTGLRFTVEQITIAGDNAEYCLAVKTKAHPKE